MIQRIGATIAVLEKHGGWVVAAFCLLPVIVILQGFLTLPPVTQRSFVSQLDRARAQVITPSGPRPCERTSASRFQCGEADWNYVGRYYTWMMDEDGYHAGDGTIRRCIWMHASPDGELRVTFPQVTLGNVLSGGHGLLNYGPRPMELVAYADDEELGRVPFHRTHRWTPWRIPTRGRRGQVVDLAFGIVVPEMGPYQYCWNGKVEH